MSDELEALQSRIDDLEDNIHVEYPAPDTPAGGEQRVRIEVPSPASVLTVGGQGWNAADGYPLGPGGVAMMTSQNFGAQIAGRACFNGFGLTIFHSAGSMRLLTQEDLGIASTHAIRVGTTDQNVEITAGDVVAHDPAFTVAPAMDVPDAPDVNTAGPRAATETVQHAMDAVFRALKSASKARGFLRGRTRGATPPSIAPQAAQVMRTVNAALQVGRALIEAGISAVEWALNDDPDVGMHGPEVMLHGAGGISMTSPRKITGFGTQGIKLGTPNKAEIQGGLNASLNSGVYASVYGAACAGLKSDGVVNVSGTTVGVSGKYVEVTGREATAITSAGMLGIESTSFISMSSPSTTIIGDTLSLAGNRRLEAYGHEVHSEARDRFVIKSLRDTVRVEAGQRIELQAGAGKVEATDRSIQLQVGQFSAALSSDAMRVGSTMSVRNREVVIRGNVRFC